MPNQITHDVDFEYVKFEASSWSHDLDVLLPSGEAYTGVPEYNGVKWALNNKKKFNF